MIDSVSDRRMAENEVVFRRRNEQMQQGFKNLKKIAQEDNQERTLAIIDGPLYFYCECSDEDCRERILINPGRYDEIHKRKDRFVVLPGHEVTQIERTISATKKYSIVEKFVLPDQSADTLKKTDVHNV